MGEDCITIEEIAQFYSEGTLLDKLAEHRTNEAILVPLLEEAHNRSLIDIKPLVLSIKSNKEIGHTFFVFRRMMTKVLVRLSLEPRDAVELFFKLHIGAGNDMAADQIFDDFLLYCKNDPDSLDALLKIAKQNPKEYSRFIPTIVLVGSEQNWSFCFDEISHIHADGQDEMRIAAVLSLGNLNWARHPDSFESGINLFIKYGEEDDDAYLSNWLISLFRAMDNGLPLDDSLKSMAIKVLEKGSDRVTDVAAWSLNAYMSNMDTSIQEAIISILPRVNPDNKGTLSKIDVAINRLLEAGLSMKAILLIEDIIKTSRAPLDGDSFSCTIQFLLDNIGALNKLITRWLMSGNRLLCLSLSEFIMQTSHENLVFRIDIEEVEEPKDKALVFIARKAIGFLFMHPVQVGHIVFSCIENSDSQDTIDDLASLMFDLLYINYPGVITKVLDSMEQSILLSVMRALPKIKKLADVHRKALASTIEKKALQPYESHLSLYRKKERAMQREVAKGIKQHSVILSNIKSNTLLFGRGAILYSGDKSSGEERLDMLLQTLSTSIEFPQMAIYDPVTLAYVLRVLKNERFKEK
jgi:hypothetical protein